MISLAVTAVTVSPWGLRNLSVFGNFALSQSEGIMMEWHYHSVQRLRGHTQTENKIKEYLAEIDGGKGCVRAADCKTAAVAAYSRAILEMPKAELVVALGISWAKLFFTGGITQMSRYLGIEPLTIEDLRGAISRVSNHGGKERAIVLWKDHLFFLLPIAGSVLFAIFGRLAGIVGIWASWSRKPTRKITIFLIGITGVFMAMYLFSSIGRFRAPLEPGLAIFAAVGFSQIWQKVRWG